MYKINKQQEIFAKYMSDKGLVSKIYQKILKYNNKKTKKYDSTDPRKISYQRQNQINNHHISLFSESSETKAHLRQKRF